MKQDAATLYTVSAGVAHVHVVPVLGERGGDLFLQPSLSPGTAVVTQGRLALLDGDEVLAREQPPAGDVKGPADASIDPPAERVEP